MAREIASNLADGYLTKLPDGSTFGEALLAPTILYADVVRECQNAEIDIHYLSNITGHGWRKIMRGTSSLSYVIETIPTPQPVFDFIQEQSKNSTEEMYSNYNMGAGYAMYLPESEAQKVIEIAKKCSVNAWVAGKVEEGAKQVVITPLDITFAGDTLEVRG